MDIQDMFLHHLNAAQTDLRAAINHLDIALASCESKLLPWKDKHRMQIARNNLRRQATILRAFPAIYQDAARPMPTLPGFLTESPMQQESPEKSQSPHIAQLDPSD